MTLLCGDARSRLLESKVMKSGIYQISGPTGMLYVGQSEDIERRLKEHKRRLRRGAHENHRLQHAWTKHGADVFQFTPLIYVPIEDLTAYEQVALDSIPIELRYNEGICVDSPVRGRKYPFRPKGLEHRKKISAALKGQRHSKEQHEKAVATRRSQSGYVFSDEHCRRLQTMWLGKRHSEETKSKMRQAQKERRKREKNDT